MNERKGQWESLVDKAREDTAPPLDVSAQVAERIVWTSAPRESIWPTWSAAGLSVAAALMMILTTSMSGGSWGDPLGDWFSTFFLVM